MPTSTDALEAARATHKGVFITGPDRLVLLEDTLPEHVFGGEHVITQSLGNCRCSSDKKAIHQFTAHARIPPNATQVALGHETIQRVVAAPECSGLHAGELILITPGHVASPHDPDTLRPDPEKGVLASLGYSYRYLGGLRQFNAIPVRAIAMAREQGFGNLFNTVERRANVSLATLAHAEPFACCYGTMKNMFFTDRSGEFRYGIPPRARVAFLGGTARMAMIKLTILASRPDDELPERIAITGSRRKLDDLAEYSLIRGLEERGVEVILVDRASPHVIEILAEPGQYDAVFTNFPSQEVYDQAVAIIAPGGNVNNYAGAVDPELYLSMTIPGAPSFESYDAEASAQIHAMHHNVAPNDPTRRRGIAPSGVVCFTGFDCPGARLDAYLAALPDGTTVAIEDAGGRALSRDRFERVARGLPGLHFVADPASALPFTDVFLAGSGVTVSEAYTRLETRLARSAAVNLIDGVTEIRIRSKHVHYTSRHQICGPTVPYTLTNTSEPVSEDLAQQGDHPIDFDWMVKGVSGLDAAVEMIHEVTKREPFGSFFAMPELEDFPYVAVDARAFRSAAAELANRVGRDGTPAIAALEAGAAVLDENGGVWSRGIEEAIYAAYGRRHPLAE